MKKMILMMLVLISAYSRQQLLGGTHQLPHEEIAQVKRKITIVQDKLAQVLDPTIENQLRNILYRQQQRLTELMHRP